MGIPDWFCSSPNKKLWWSLELVFKGWREVSECLRAFCVQSKVRWQMGMWNCGKPPATEKNKALMCKAKVWPCSSWLSILIIHWGNWSSFLSNKSCFSILYHCMERILAKRLGGGGRQSFLLIKDNIWQAEYIKKALFKARRLSSHRLFKRLEKMLAIIYFHLLSEISLSVYWEGELKAKVKRAYFFC